MAALLLCSLSVSAYADKKQELYDLATKAGTAGNVVEAARLFCEVSKLDEKFKDSKQLCTLMTQEAEREGRRSDDRYAEGQKAFQEGRFDDAEQKFKNVRAGSHVDEARQYLARIPAARNEKQAGEAENAKFEQGNEAYRRNDFAAAKIALGQVSGKRASDAQSILDNIKRYEDAIAAGDSAVAAKDWPKAIASYNQAIGIKHDGPGDLAAKVARATQAASTPAAPPPTVAVQKPEEKPPSAVKETRAIDVNKLLREATSAQARGDYGSASGKYLAVLAADPANAVARRGLEFVSAKNVGGRQSAGSDADIMLARAVREFYSGFYEDAEVHIKDYVNAKGSRTGLSNFYLGACELTRYYLAGERDSDKKLLADAKVYFRIARGTAGFVPPDQSVVSPKILKAYEQSSQ